eukprot:1161154-Pelagomonas_calceolata.AAC.2
MDQQNEANDSPAVARHHCFTADCDICCVLPLGSQSKELLRTTLLSFLSCSAHLAGSANVTSYDERQRA